MSYVLDTNTLSSYMRSAGDVVARVQAEAPANIVLPAMVVFEVSYGLCRLGRQAQLAAFGRFVQSVPVLDFDLDAADEAARIRVHLESLGTPISLSDLLVAATARRHGCTLVTHNTREFSRVPDLVLEDWY